MWDLNLLEKFKEKTMVESELKINEASERYISSKSEIESSTNQ